MVGFDAILRCVCLRRNYGSLLNVSLNWITGYDQIEDVLKTKAKSRMLELAGCWTRFMGTEKAAE